MKVENYPIRIIEGNAFTLSVELQQIAFGHGTGTLSEFVPLESDRIRVWLVSKCDRIEAFNVAISANELLFSFDRGMKLGLYDIEIFVYRANNTQLHCRLEKRIYIVPTTDNMGIEAETIKLTGAVMLVIDGVSLQWDDIPTIGSGAVVTSNGIAEALNELEQTVSDSTAMASSIINLNTLLSSSNAYTLETAIAALISFETSTGKTYRKSGLVLTYQTDADLWESKQFVGDLAHFANETLWEDFGSGKVEVDVDTTNKVFAIKDGKGQDVGTITVGEGVGGSVTLTLAKAGTNGQSVTVSLPTLAYNSQTQMLEYVDATGTHVPTVKLSNLQIKGVFAEIPPSGEWGLGDLILVGSNSTYDLKVYDGNGTWQSLGSINNVSLQAEQIDFNNTSNGFSATTVQTAIEETLRKAENKIKEETNAWQSVTLPTSVKAYLNSVGWLTAHSSYTGKFLQVTENTDYKITANVNSSSVVVALRYNECDGETGHYDPDISGPAINQPANSLAGEDYESSRFVIPAGETNVITTPQGTTYLWIAAKYETTTKTPSKIEVEAGNLKEVVTELSEEFNNFTENIGDSVVTELTNKDIIQKTQNLLNLSKAEATSHGITWKINKDKLTITGTSTAQTDLLIPLDSLELEAGTYTFSMQGTVTTDRTMNFYIGNSSAYIVNGAGISNGVVTFTLSNDLVATRLLIRIQNGTTVNVEAMLQLEKGSEKTDYLPSFSVRDAFANKEIENVKVSVDTIKDAKLIRELPLICGSITYTGTINTNSNTYNGVIGTWVRVRDIIFLKAGSYITFTNNYYFVVNKFKSHHLNSFERNVINDTSGTGRSRINISQDGYYSISFKKRPITGEDNSLYPEDVSYTSYLYSDNYEPALDVAFLGCGGADSSNYYGDCTLFRTSKGKNIIIDFSYSAPMAGELKKALYYRGVKRVDHAIITHYHNDHVVGLLYALKEGILDFTNCTFYLPDEKSYMEYLITENAPESLRNNFAKHPHNMLLAYINGETSITYNSTDSSPKTVPQFQGNVVYVGVNIEETEVTDETTQGTTIETTRTYKTKQQVINVDDVIFEFWNTNHSVYEGVSTNYNDWSLCCDVIYGSNRICMTGDLGPIGESKVYSSMKKANILKSGHHGWQSGSAMNANFINRIYPDIVVTEDARGHHDSTQPEYVYNRGNSIQDWCEKNGIPNYRTFINKTMDFHITRESIEMPNRLINYVRGVDWNLPFGTTDIRPLDKRIGTMYFDTTLRKPIWWDGENWVDSTGAIV